MASQVEALAHEYLRQTDDQVERADQYAEPQKSASGSGSTGLGREAERAWITCTH